MTGLFTKSTMASLKEHEKLCEIRYAAVEKRLVDLEAKIDDLTKKIDGFQQCFIQIAVKIGISLFVAICGAVFVIKV